MNRKSQTTRWNKERPEWSAKEACEYWPDMRMHWAPVSWKDHLYDFNVFYNGTILAHATGLGMNVNIPPEDQIFASELRIKLMTSNPVPADDGKSGLMPTHTACDISLLQGLQPDGRHLASWEETAAPVYVIEHAVLAAPILVKQKQFAHVPGGRPVKRGDEPHFLWVRLEVSDVIEEINPHQKVYACLSVLAPSVLTGMGAFNSVAFNYGYRAPVYPMRLEFEGDQSLADPGYLRHATPYAGVTGAYLTGKRNRWAAPGGQKRVAARALPSQFFASAGWGKNLTHLILEWPVQVGARVDFVYPFVPVDDATMDRELALGYDGALAETERFWKKELQTRTSVRVSEPLLQGWIDNFPRLTAMIAQKHPASGWYGCVSSSLNYEAMWPTAFSLQAYALEFLGYGAEVDKYLDVYRRYQGQAKPPSPHLAQHPGYFGAPKELAGVHWITDHAGILWAAANHAALSRDPDFVRRWTTPILQACAFIRDARRAKGHGGLPGILPPAVSNDSGWCSQTVWNNAWYHKALKTAAAFLEDVGHPAGRRFRLEAEDYRQTFRKLFRDVVAQSKQWRAPDGTKLPFVPPALACATGEEAAHCFNLDCGAMVLVFGELFEAADPVMKAAVRWFREGPQRRIYRRFSSEFQTPVLDHEVSSCEPCYSWNVLHSYELGDRQQFAMGLYGVFAAGASRENFVGFETRDAVSGNVFSHGFGLLLARLAVVAERDRELHLHRMAPLAFFRAGGLAWQNVPTLFGEVSIAAAYREPAGTLEVHYAKPRRAKPVKTVLHVPPLPGLRRVVVNGKDIGRTAGTVTL